MNRLKQIAIVVLVFISAMWLWDLFRPEPFVDEDEPLQVHEAARIVVADRKVSALTSSGAKATYVPSSGHTVISVQKDGTTKMTVKNKGLSLQAGLGGVYADRLRLTADLQVGYWNRTSVHLGLAIADAPVVVPYVALGYRLDRIRLNNTSVIVGISARKDIVLGVRIEL
jgi:hypothetical protein